MIGATPYLSTATATATAKTGTGWVFAGCVTNSGAAVKYFQIWNGSTSGTLAFVVAVPPTSSVILTESLLGCDGLQVNTNIVFGWSTSPGSYVAATAAECHTFLEIK